MSPGERRKRVKGGSHRVCTEISVFIKGDAYEAIAPTGRHLGEVAHRIKADVHHADQNYTAVGCAHYLESVQTHHTRTSMCNNIVAKNRG